MQNRLHRFCIAACSGGKPVRGTRRGNAPRAILFGKSGTERLPLCGESQPAPTGLECPNLGQSKNPPKGRTVPHILVIDDQKHVRTAIVLALQAKGFDVVGAESGQSGLTKFEQSEFDVVIADIFMPGVDGVTLIKALRKRHPGLPVIAMSGVLLDGSGRTALDHLTNISELADVICLQKPFRPNDLLQAVAAALATGAAPAGTAAPTATSGPDRGEDVGSERPA
jgi:CheY-like chemotaxis protein